MPEPLTVISAYGTAGNFDGEAVGFLAVTATGAGLAADTMEFVSDVVAHEIDVADAADYERTTAIGAVSTVGDDQVLGPAPAETPTFDLAGAPSVGGFWLYDPTTGVDATMALIGFLPQTAAAGLAVHTVNATNGWVKWRKQPIDLEQRVTSLEDRTVPDAADGDPNQVWTTDGAAGSWQDPAGGSSALQVNVIVADADLSGGSFTELTAVGTQGDPLGAGTPIPRAFLVGGRVAVYSGTDGGQIFTITASGACTLTTDQLTVGQAVQCPNLNDAAAPFVTAYGWNADAGVEANYYDLPVTELRATEVSFADLDQDYDFVTSVNNLRNEPYVNQGDDGGGVTSYLNAHRAGDPDDYYIAANPAANMSSSGTPYGGGAFALMDQANGINGGFHGAIVPVGLAPVTITTPLGDLVVDVADFIVPRPVAGDVIGIRALTVDGQWKHSNLKQGQKWSVGTSTWQSTTTGMATNFVDVSPGTVVAQTITNGVTTSAPSQDAVYDALALKAPLTTAVAALTPTTGTVDLDLATVNGEYRTHALSGNVTYTSSNRAVGKSVTVKVLCDATPRTFTFPAWVFVGTAPTGIAANKTGILTVTWFGAADTDAVAAWSVQA